MKQSYYIELDTKNNITSGKVIDLNLGITFKIIDCNIEYNYPRTVTCVDYESEFKLEDLSSSISIRLDAKTENSIKSIKI
jgi:hypothetical protein